MLCGSVHASAFGIAVNHPRIHDISRFAWRKSTRLQKELLNPRRSQNLSTPIYLLTTASKGLFHADELGNTFLEKKRITVMPDIVI